MEEDRLMLVEQQNRELFRKMESIDKKPPPDHLSPREDAIKPHFLFACSQRYKAMKEAEIHSKNLSILNRL